MQIQLDPGYRSNMKRQRFKRRLVNRLSLVYHASKPQADSALGNNVGKLTLSHNRACTKGGSHLFSPSLNAFKLPRSASTLVGVSAALICGSFFEGDEAANGDITRANDTLYPRH